MKLFFLAAFVILVASIDSFAGQIYGIVRDSTNQEPLIGCGISLKPSKLGTFTNKNGEFSIKNIPAGTYTLHITAIGYSPVQTQIVLRSLDSLFISIALQPKEIESDEVVVTEARTGRRIDDVPTQIEVLPAADLDESITVGISSARMVLGEIPGIMAQVNSSSIGSATVRIRGLDGRYTQILQDGIPSFGGINMNFSVLLLPPLNLRQLEIIKGSAAGLHGADAVGGMINYITRIPEKTSPEATVVATASSIGGVDVGGFYGQLFGDMGFSLHATANTQPKRDIDGDKFIDVPLQQRFSINPKFLWNFSHSKWTITGSYTHEKRFGGEISAPENFTMGTDSLFSTALTTRRFDISNSFLHTLNDDSRILINGALARTERTSFQKTTPFNGNETTLYADAEWTVHSHLLLWTVGIAAKNQSFNETTSDILTHANRSYNFTTLSGFAQAEYAVSSLLTALASARIDNHSLYGMQILPRLSLMLRPTDRLTIRAGVGTGWRAPTIFDETAEERNFRGVPAISLSKGEQSIGYTFDTEYKIIAAEWIITTNLNLFSMVLNNRATLSPIDSFVDNRNQIFTWNSVGALTSRGAEVITEVKHDDLSLFFGYTFADVSENNQGTTLRKDFSPLHFINAAVLWELPNTIRIVSDFMLQSPQNLPTNPYSSTSQTVITWGGSVEVWIGRGFSLFVNVENALDARQTRSMPLYIGSPRSANFNGNFVWGPVEGRVASIGVKYKI
jgi:iron complex outermembrane receptor protein